MTYFNASAMIYSVSRQDELQIIRHPKIRNYEEIQIEETLVVDLPKSKVVTLENLRKVGGMDIAV